MDRLDGDRAIQDSQFSLPITDQLHLLLNFKSQRKSLMTDGNSWWIQVVVVWTMLMTLPLKVNHSPYILTTFVLSVKTKRKTSCRLEDAVPLHCPVVRLFQTVEVNVEEEPA